MKEYIDRYSICKTERPTRRRRNDDDDDEREERGPRENTRRGTKDERTDQPRGGDRDKNCHGEINTIIGGPAYNRKHEPSSSTSSKGKGKQVMNVEPKRLRVDNTISFSNKDYEGVQTPHIDALVILARITKWRIRRIMVDTG